MRITTDATSLTEREQDVLRLLATGCSDREIADELVLTVGTVKWYNRQIYNKLSVSNRTEAVTVAHKNDLLQGNNGNGITQSQNHISNLPAQLTSFIGRQHEIKKLIKLLDSGQRLITLTGPPGVGKTRLAQEFVAKNYDRYGHGAYFVSLIGVNQPDDLLQTLIQIVNLKPSSEYSEFDLLQQNLQRKEMIFLLDNFEHVLSAATIVSGLLTACPSLTFIVTSREVLNIYGEAEFPVAPLLSPKLSLSIPLEQMLSYDAVQLFVERARRNDPQFTVDEQNMDTVAMICTHLDGLPLAIELAAARIKYFAPQTLMMRLSSRLDILTDGPRDFPSRQQTLRATLAWSYDLLNDDEKRLFTYLAVFRGDFTIEAIKAICGQDLEQNHFDVLVSLIDKNLVYRERHSNRSVRFHMLQTIHEYACEKLQERDNINDLYARLADYYINFAQDAKARLFKHDHLFWVGIVEVERDNLRTILDWSVASGHYDYGIRLSGILADFWRLNGYFREGREWTGRLINHLNAAAPEFRSPFLLCAGLMNQREGSTLASELLIESLDAARQCNNQHDEAIALLFLGLVEMDQCYARQGLQLSQQLNDEIGLLTALNTSGEISRFHGDYQAARESYQTCLELAREKDDLYFIDVAETNLTFVDQQLDHHEKALERMKAVAKMNCQLNSIGCLLQQLIIAAISVAALGELHRGVRLLGAGESLMRRVGSAFSQVDYQDVKQGVDHLRGSLDEAQFAAAYAEGEQMSLMQAYVSAFGEPDQDTKQLLETYFSHWLD